MALEVVVVPQLIAHFYILKQSSIMSYDIVFQPIDRSNYCRGIVSEQLDITIFKINYYSDKTGPSTTRFYDTYREGL